MSLRQVSSYRPTAHLYRLLTTRTSCFPQICVCAQPNQLWNDNISKFQTSSVLLKLHRLVLQLPTGGLLELSVAPMNQVSTCFTFWLEHTHIRSTEQQDVVTVDSVNCRVAVHLTVGLINQAERGNESKMQKWFAKPLYSQTKSNSLLGNSHIPPLVPVKVSQVECTHSDTRGSDRDNLSAASWAVMAAAASTMSWTWSLTMKRKWMASLRTGETAYWTPGFLYCNMCCAVLVFL